jgi:S1-C subfamily serine protease
MNRFDWHRFVLTIIGGSLAIVFGACVKEQTVESLFAGDFHCSGRVTAVDLGNARYRVNGCDREAVYQCIERGTAERVCSIQMATELEREEESEQSRSGPRPAPVKAHAEVVKDDDGSSTVELDVRLDTYSTLALRADPQNLPDSVLFTFTHQLDDNHVKQCDFGMMLDGQVVSTPKIAASKRQYIVTLSTKLPRAFVRDLGVAQKVTLKACSKRWALHAEQVEELHRFVELYEEEVAWKVTGRKGGSGGRITPRGGWPEWTPEGSPPAALAGNALATPELFQRLSPSVLMVEAFTARGVGQGSAVAITRTEALTNCHVVEGALKIVVKQEKKEFVAQVKRADPVSDRCVLFVAEPVLTPIGGVRAFDTLTVGEPLFTIGAPSGFDLTLSDGILSGRREASGRSFVQTTAPVSPGSSGGGLFDARGNLVGITTLVVVGAEKLNQALNFAIPADTYWKP